MTIETPAQVLLERKGPIAWLRFNRPQAMNALTHVMMDELAGHLAALRDDDGCRVVVLTGSGRAFSAGVDLKEVGADAGDRNPTEFFMESAARATDIMAIFPKPLIAAINGVAMAGGLELTLNCDLIVASSSARIADAHANFGLIPGGGSTARLPARVGMSLAKYMIFSGDGIALERLKQAGLLLDVYASETFEADVTRLAETLASRSPLAIARAKRLIDDAPGLSLRDAVAAEAALAVRHSSSEDAQEGFRAFAEKRRPNFIGS